MLTTAGTQAARTNRPATGRRRRSVRTPSADEATRPGPPGVRGPAPTRHEGQVRPQECGAHVGRRGPGRKGDGGNYAALTPSVPFYCRRKVHSDPCFSPGTRCSTDLSLYRTGKPMFSGDELDTVTFRVNGQFCALQTTACDASVTICGRPSWSSWIASNCPFTSRPIKKGVRFIFEV